MSPVAARADAGDVAELAVGVHLGEFFGGESLAGLGGVDVEADGALVHGLHDVVAIRVKDVVETEVVDHAAVFVKLNDHVANRVDALAVRTAVVGVGDAQEAVAVLGVVKGVGVVGVLRRKLAVEDFAAHQVVLDVALAEAPGEGAVLRLLEAHHVAGGPRVGRVADQRVEQVPADGAGRVDDADVGVECPFKRTTRRVVPGEAGALRAPCGAIGESWLPTR